MKPRIQRVELNCSDIAIHCPFCGQKVIPNSEEDTSMAITPCRPHTLFIATDEGFEYRSPRFDAAMSLTGVADDDIDLPDTGFDGLTDQFPLDGAIKFALFTPAPSALGMYVGFVPT